MYKVWVLIFLSNLLIANTIIDIYKNSGIKEVEKYVESQLQSKRYWKNYLGKKNVDFGYYENSKYILLTDKISKIMRIYKVNKNGLNYIKSQKVIVGKKGDKEREGDLKTPLGVYRLVKKFKPQDQFYGPFAYVLSYPNLYDKLQGKNGHGIWIHGSPLNGKKRDNRSKGCVVLKNYQLKELDNIIVPTKSMIVISEGELEKVSKDDLSIILSSLFQWRYAWKYNKLLEYLSFYSKNFIRFDGKNKKSFASMKKRIFSRGEKKEIIFKDIDISPYPNLENRKLFRVSFYEKYKTKRYKFSGRKELYIELKNGKFQILAEK